MNIMTIISNTKTMGYDLSFQTIIAATIAVIALVYLFLMLNRKRTNSRNNRNPPQADGAWPIIGHLHLLGGSQLPHKVLGNMAEKYGPIFAIKLGVHQVLVVSDAEMAKECFTTNDKVFASRPKSVAVELMGYNYAMFGLAPYGQHWRQVRKIAVLELLSQRRLEMLGHIRVSEVRTSIRDTYGAWTNSKESGGLNAMKVEMKQWFGNLVLNIVVRMISGKRFPPNDEEGVRFQEVVRKFFELLGAFVVSDAIPWLKFLDLGGYEKAMKMTATEMDNIFERWLEEHKREKDSGRERDGKQQVFMDVMISVLQGSSEEDFPGFDQDTVIKATCLALLTAATDTTTVTLTWALSLLLNNPKSLKLAQDELDKQVGRERLVEESDVTNLVYLQAIIKETLRLYPAAPLSVPHESMQECLVGGYSVPKGTRLLLNTWKIHHDPNIWSDPYEFRPERFLENQKDVDVKGKHFELIPFGSGRRMCPGISFGLQALHLTMASLIQGFELMKPSNEPIDMSESFGLTNMKATPLEVLITPRLPTNMYS